MLIKESFSSKKSIFNTKKELPFLFGFLIVAILITNLVASFSGVKNIFFNNSIIFSPLPGTYKQTIQVELKSTKKDTTIYYTLDGTTPDLKSLKYTQPITVEKGALIKAQAYFGRSAVGNLFTASYSILPNNTFNVVHLTTDNENLWDKFIGIYAKGKGFDIKDEVGTANYFKKGPEWERPVFFEYFNKDGKKIVDQNLGIRIAGARTRGHPQKSFRLCSKRSYESKFVRAKLFDNSDEDKFRCFVLRNAGNDWRSAFIRDGVAQTIASGLNFETQNHQPVHVLLNGEYWGIYYLQERFDEYSLAIKYDVEPKDIVLIEPDIKQYGYPNVVNGKDVDAKSYIDLLTFINAVDLSDQKNFEYVKSVMDINNFIDYYIVETFFVNSDWPDNNIKLWRYDVSDNSLALQPQLDGKWRWLFYDLDTTFINVEVAKFDFINLVLGNKVDKINGISLVDKWYTIWLRSFIKNDEFKQLYVTRAQDLLNTNLTVENTLNVVNQKEQILLPEMQKHVDRWGGFLDKGGFKSFTAVGDWQKAVDTIRQFLYVRHKSYKKHIAHHFDTNGVYNIAFQTNIDNAGSIKFGLVQHNSTLEKSYTIFGKYEFLITANPLPGYKFVKWSGDVNSTSSSITISTTKDVKLIAEFAPTWFTNFKQKYLYAF